MAYSKFRGVACKWLAARVVVVLFAAACVAQSAVPLGDIARQLRKSPPKPAIVYDNDNIPKTDKLSVVGPAQEPPAEVENDVTADAPAPAAAQAPDKQQALVSSLDAQRRKVDLLTRELDVLNREYRLRAAAFYADAGNRLRNPGSWDKQDSEYKQEIAAKQKTLDEAKTQLDTMQEQARKAGVPAQLRE